jgi:hypothetical protein
MNILQIPREEYAENISRPFNPAEFNAKEIVTLAKLAGQKYLVFTSRHHDGFSMYDTQVRTFRDYKLMGFGDYSGPDPLAELSRECKAQGVRFGVYYSVPDWYDLSQSNMGNTMDPDMKDEYMTRMKGQLREIVDIYDADLIWFDMGGDRNWWNVSDGEEIYRFLRTIKPSLIVNNRLFIEGDKSKGDFGTPEQIIPGGSLNFYWESCLTLNGSWGYKTYDTNWKSAETVVANIIDVASKGGNLLLNIGPDGLGRVPEASAMILEQTGAWLSVYGDSIYGTRQSIFGNLPDGHRATVKEGVIYLHIMNFPPSHQVTVPMPSNDLQTIRDMGSGNTLAYSHTESFLTIDLAGVTPDPYATVIEISVAGMPAAKEMDNIARKASDVQVSDYYNNMEQYNGWKAVDGDYGTRWATNNGITAAALTLIFDEPVTVNTCFLRQHAQGESGSNWTSAFLLEYLDNGEWKTAYTGGDPGLEFWFDFEAFTAAQIRLNITDAQHPTFWEFELYHFE